MQDSVASTVMSADRTRGVTGDLEGIDCREEEGTSGNNRVVVSVIGGKLLANMVEMASRAARKLADNLIWTRREKGAINIERLHHFFC